MIRRWVLRAIGHRTILRLQGLLPAKARSIRKGLRAIPGAAAAGAGYGTTDMFRLPEPAAASGRRPIPLGGGTSNLQTARELNPAMPGSSGNSPPPHNLAAAERNRTSSPERRRSGMSGIAKVSVIGGTGAVSARSSQLLG